MTKSFMNTGFIDSLSFRKNIHSLFHRVHMSSNLLKFEIKYCNISISLSNISYNCIQDMAKQVNIFMFFEKLNKNYIIIIAAFEVQLSMVFGVHH